jgi:hypothetical protein
MKLLIPLIILFTITCLGQSDSIKDRSYYIAGDIQSDPQIIINYQGQTTPVDTLYRKNQLLKIFLNEYQQYEAECFADSTEECFAIYVYTSAVFYQNNERTVWADTTYGRCGTIDPGINPAYQGERMIYTHREPTFTGFMEFLKNKYK